MLNVNVRWRNNMIRDNNTKILAEIEKELRKFEEYWNGDDLLKYKVSEDIRKYDEYLLKNLLDNKIIRNAYTVKVGDAVIFKTDEFLDMFIYHAYFDNNYTKYANYIGLASEEKYINYNSDVVINYPYKDCVLEGGMTKREQEKEEVFYHKIIAKEEIDILFSPKVLHKAQKYESGFFQEINEFSIKDNLLIKGNNLIALHSIKEKYAGKIKLIYIDPPFNTKGNRFGYNDNFTRSTWLTFMKNRLEIAKELLTPDGSIFVHIDHNQAHYLKVLMDEVFGESKFMNEIIWRYRTYIGQVKEFFPKKHDTIFWYINETRPSFKLSNVGNFEDTPDYKRWQAYLNEEGEIVYPDYPKTDSRFMAYLKRYIKQNGQPSDGDVIYKNEGYVVDDVWDDIIALDAKNKTERISEFSGDGQKPEALLERIIDSVTVENDIVLDFFMGSGTTAAVAHKMNRRYIGIEQLDYFYSVPVERLKKVVDGDNGGISRNVNWRGGGSFITLELYSLNNVYYKEIINAETLSDLNNIKIKIEENGYLNVQVDLRAITFDEDLSIEEYKKVLLEILDINQQYLSLSEINDEKYNIDDKVKEFNYSFYEVLEENNE